MSRLLVPAAALLWGLQCALLNAVLALLLVALHDADPTQVGAVQAGGRAVERHDHGGQNVTERRVPPVRWALDRSAPLEEGYV